MLYRLPESERVCSGICRVSESVFLLDVNAGCLVFTHSFYFKCLTSGWSTCLCISSFTLVCCSSCVESGCGIIYGSFPSMYVLNYISLVFPIDPTGASPSGWRWNAERYSSSCDAYVVSILFIIMTAIYGFLVKGTSVYRLFVSIR